MSGYEFTMRSVRYGDIGPIGRNFLRHAKTETTPSPTFVCKAGFSSCHHVPYAESTIAAVVLFGLDY